MKKIISTLFILTTWTLGFAQSGLELSIGPSFTNVTMKGVDASFRPDRTLHGGVQAQALWHQAIPGGNFGFSSGIAFKEKGFHIDEGITMDVLNIPMKVGIEVITTFRYVELPLNIKYSTGTGPITAYIYAGPTAGYAVNAVVRTRTNFLVDININKTKLDLSQNIYNRFELGANAGLGAEFKLGHGALVAQTNYAHGFNRVIDNTVIDLRVKNYGFGMNLGYKIMF